MTYIFDVLNAEVYDILLFVHCRERVMIILVITHNCFT